MMNFDERLYAFETVRDNIKQLITAARENSVEVVYVQHDDGPGTDLDKSEDNYEIYEQAIQLLQGNVIE